MRMCILNEENLRIITIFYVIILNESVHIFEFVSNLKLFRQCHNTLFVVCAHFKQIMKLRIDNCSFNAEQMYINMLIDWVYKYQYSPHNKSFY